MKPLVQYFDPESTTVVEPGEMIHEYYGVPPWLMKTYLAELGATAQDDETMVWETGCRAMVRAAEPRQIGSLIVGGSVVEFTGCQGNLETMLEELEWKTLRIGA